MLVLASASPRRREMLEMFPFDIEVTVPEIEEHLVPGESSVETAERLACEKMREVVRRRGDAFPVLAADTIVVVRKEMLGKPRDARDAEYMLRLLSGTVHQVITGVAIGWKGAERVFSVSSDVVFRSLSEKEIADYIASGEPMDKAGAYAVQGLGGAFVSRVHGSVSNVIGLPLAEVTMALQEMGFLDGMTQR